MSSHSKIKYLLYDYLHDELTNQQRLEVEQHLKVCGDCKSDYERLHEALQIISMASSKPSDERPPEFWDNFILDVEEKIKVNERESRVETSRAQSIKNNLAQLLKKPTLAWGSVAIVFFVAFYLCNVISPPTQILKEEKPEPQQAVGTRQNDYLENYLSKSKILLVGLTNLDIDEKEPLDLSAERKVSLDLVEKARYLEHQPIDPSTAQLIGTLEKIQKEFANMREENELQNIQNIQNSIIRKNLLFKVRMAENMYGAARFAGHSYEGDHR